ncbi:MAG: LLM class flavin-dependent oxidoreductase [Dehalococcoidia bacterium]
MKFSVGYWTMGQTRLRPRHHALLYEELVRDCVTAEDLGYDAIWLAEHHFWYDGHSNALLTILGAMAAETDKLKIGTSMLLLPIHDPLRLAENIACVDHLSGGRLRLGFGLGYREEEFDAYGISMRQRASRTDETLELLLKLWRSDEPIDHEGRHFTYRGPVCRPKPLQSPHPAIAMGGFVPATVERAARFGFGIYLGPVMNGEQAAGLLDIYRANLSDEHAQKPRDVGILRDFWVAETEAELEEGRQRLRNYYGETVALGWRLFRDEAGTPIGPDRGRLLRAYVDASVGAGIIGTPEQVTRELKQFEQLGFDHIQLRFRFDSQPAEKIHKAMRLFAEEVMPAFQS